VRRSVTITDFLLRRIEEEEIRAEYVRQFGDTSGIFGPERILAECEAKRAVIGWWTNGAIGYAVSEDGEMTNPLLPLAAVYASHPDYQQEWAL
jgi:hypothetical protein